MESTQQSTLYTEASYLGEDFDPSSIITSSVHNLKEIKPIAVLREHENSVDCISANPTNQNEFVTGSHDKSIKLWDVNQQKSTKTMLGHKEGVWCINYNKDGTQIVTASPEGIAKLWDPKTGKSTADLKGHTKRVFWATYNNASTMVATCGSDRLVLQWDLRKTATPIAQNNCKIVLLTQIENESVVLSCEYLQGDEFLVTTNLEGDINVISQRDQFNIVKHHTLHEGQHHKTNTAFCCQTIRNPEEPGTFLIGAEDKHVTKFNFDARDYELEKVGVYMGHSHSVRNIQVSKDMKHMLSSCQDHSLRLWDYRSYEPLIIFSGHKDNVSGAAFLTANTFVSSSWDLKVMIWKF